MGVLFYVWAMLLVVSVIIEIATTDLTSFWFSIGAIAALILNLFFKDSLVWLQNLAFSVLSILAILFVRPIVKKKLKLSDRTAEINDLVGKYALVTSKIDGEQNGLVKIHGVEWVALSKDGKNIGAGEMVYIDEIIGNKLIVKKN